MKYLNATPQQRFLAYFIDYAIIGFVSDIILNNFIYPAVKIDTELLQNKLTSFYESLYNGSIDLVTMEQILVICLLIIGFTVLVTVVLAFIYFCIIPLFWEKQTVGRLAASVKVVSMKDEGKVGFGWLFLREIIGGCILTNLFGSSLVIPVVLTIVFSINKGRSLADMIGRTRLVNTKMIVNQTPNYNFYSGDNQSSSDDYVDARFKDVEKKSNDDDYMVI